MDLLSRLKLEHRQTLDKLEVAHPLSVARLKDALTTHHYIIDVPYGQICMLFALLSLDYGDPYLLFD